MTEFTKGNDTCDRGNMWRSWDVCLSSFFCPNGIIMPCLMAQPPLPLYLHGKFSLLSSCSVQLRTPFFLVFRDHPGCMGFKEICPDAPKYTVLKDERSDFIQIIKLYVSDNTCEHFGFLTVGENIYRSKRAIIQPLTGSNGLGKGRCVG